MQGQTRPREPTSVLDLRLQQYLLLRAIALLPRPASPRTWHTESCSTLDTGHRAQETHGTLPISSPHPASPTGRAKMPA